ncbi:MAG: NAD(P)H-dependent oxidoreductase [Hyphomicrobiales bacterium]|nr:NAD(P)H-dependent oxidoreductase [Hyphomicrobiales bacterium]
MTDFKILAVSGSLRKNSFNTAALRAMQELAPAGVTIELAEIGDLPLYDDDVREQGYPATVQRFRAQVAAADAVILATPEYNYSVSAPLKNAIDWASRAPAQPFGGKPVAILSAATGPMGGVRAQYHLRHMLVSTNSHVLNAPQIMITGAGSKFDAEGRFTDQAGRDLMVQMIDELVKWARRLKA